MTRCPSFPLLLLLAVFPATASAQSFAGSTSLASEPFSLEEGLVIADMEHGGGGAFRARILDQTGAVVEELASSTGAFSGSRALRVPRSDRYLLDVVADGTWTVRIRRLGEVAAADLGDHPELAEARQEGTAHAGEPGVLGWFGGGMAAGFVSGPIGAVVVTRMAGGRDRELTAAARAHLADRDGVYDEAFRGTYDDQLRLRRQRAALRGSLVGTAALGFVLIRYTNLARPGGGEDGGSTPDLVRIPMVRIPVGF